MEFSESGTDTWFRKHVEWFLIYPFTEMGATPHNIRQGYSLPSLMDAYDAIVHELEERRYDPWRRNDTTKMARAYLVCIDELTVLEEIFTKKLDFFQRPRKDVETFELQEPDINKPPNRKDGETHWDRIAFAEHAMAESATQCKRLSADLRESMGSVSFKHFKPQVMRLLQRLTYRYTALPAPLHRAEQTCHNRGYTKQGPVRFHRDYDNLFTTFVLHIIFRHEPQKRY